MVIPIILSLNDLQTSAYFNMKYFYRYQLDVSSCPDGSNIPCHKDKDCERNRMREYCLNHQEEGWADSIKNPFLCGQIVKCNDEGFCAEFCH